jgi:hypothetical protein
MKKKMTKAEKDRVNMHAAGFRDGCEYTAQGLFATTRLLGFKELASELERQHDPVYSENFTLMLAALGKTKRKVVRARRLDS